MQDNKKQGFTLIRTFANAKNLDNAPPALLRTNRHAKNLDNVKSRSGFTLIETIVIVFAFVMVSLMSVTFLLTTLVGNSKIDVTNEVRQNGNYALSSTERLLISSKSVICNSSKKMTVTMLDGTSTAIECVDDGIDSRIASGSGYLTNTNVKVDVSSCLFVCNQTMGVPETVDISFVVSQKTANPKTSETSSQTFQTKVVIRNQTN